MGERALVNFGYGLQDARRLGLFKQVAGGARLKRFENILIILIYRAHNKLRIAAFRFQLLYAIYTAYSRQVNIH